MIYMYTCKTGIHEHVGSTPKKTKLSPQRQRGRYLTWVISRQDTAYVTSEGTVNLHHVVTFAALDRAGDGCEGVGCRGEAVSGPLVGPLPLLVAGARL